MEPGLTHSEVCGILSRGNQKSLTRNLVSDIILLLASLWGPGGTLLILVNLYRSFVSTSWRLKNRRTDSQPRLLVFPVPLAPAPAHSPVATCSRCMSERRSMPSERNIFSTITITDTALGTMRLMPSVQKVILITYSGDEN